MNLLFTTVFVLATAGAPEPAYVTAERTYAMNLLKPAEATAVSAKSGKWADASTWAAGVVPADGAKVQIAASHDVEIHTQLTERIKWIRVDGTLSFCRACDTRLTVDTIVVTDSGTLDIGTAAAPITGNCEIVIADNGPIDLVADPKEFGRGIVAMGPVLIHGMPKTRIADLAGAVAVGATMVTLTTPPLNWKTGETIVVAGTDWSNPLKSFDVCKIQSVVGNVVNLVDPLKFAHGLPAPYKVFVIHLDSNVVIRSEKSGYGTEPLNSLVKQAGHVMIMHDAVGKSVIKYAAFRDMGRTDKRVPLSTLAGTNRVGRYILHFHRGMISGPPGIVEGCVAQSTSGWGFTNHSSNVNFRDCVTFDCLGAGFVGEIGDERGQVENCAAINCQGNGADGMFTRSLAKEIDFGFEGLGFWFQGSRIKVRNIKTANNKFAFGIWALAIIGQTPTGPEGWIDPSDVADEPYLNDFVEGGKIALSAARCDIDGIYAFCCPKMTDTEHIFPRSGLSTIRNITYLSDQVPPVSIFGYLWNTQVDGCNFVCLNPKVLPEYYRTIISGGQSQSHNYSNCKFIGGGLAIELPGFGLNRVTDCTFACKTALGPRLAVTHHELGPFGNKWLRPREVHLSGNTYLTQANGTPTTPIGIWPLQATMDAVASDRLFIDGQELYQADQAPTYVPFPKARSDVPAYLIGLSNEQMKDQWGFCARNSLKPASAVKSTTYQGYLGVPSKRKGVWLDAPFPQHDLAPGTVVTPVLRLYDVGVAEPVKVTLPPLTIQPGFNPIVCEVDGEKYGAFVLGKDGPVVPPPPPPVAVASVALKAATATVEIGKSQQFTALLSDAAGNTLTGRVVVWSASIPNNATVSPTGLVTGVAAGVATITATCEGKSASADVTVVAPPPPAVLHDIVRANSYDNGWKQAWQANAKKVFSTPVQGITKTPGLVIHVGDSMTLSQAYGQWISRAPGRTADDLAIAAWMHAGQQVSNGFNLSGGGVTAFENMGWADQRIDAMLAKSTVNSAQVAILMMNSPGQSTAIVETRCNQFIAKGILPVLSTVPPRTAQGYDAAVTDPFNLALAGIAKKLAIPLIDYNAEIKLRRPNGTWDGTLIGSNDVHPTGGVAGFKPDSDAYTPGGDPAKHATGDAALNSGYLLRTWLTAQKLKEIKPLASVPVVPPEPVTVIVSKANGLVAFGTLLGKTVVDVVQQADGTFKVTLGP